MKDNHKADVSHTDNFNRMYQEMVKQAEDKYKVKSKYPEPEKEGLVEEETLIERVDDKGLPFNEWLSHKGAFHIPDGYELKDENGNIINATKIVLEKKEINNDMNENNTKVDMGEVSDGYHTFNELYEYRMLYNAALFNEFAKQELYDVHKSRKHSDGEYPFGDSNWFIVMAELPTGQISNHYEMKDWDKFQIPEKEVANKWDGHSPRDVAERLTSFTTPKKEYPKTYEECCDKLNACSSEHTFLVAAQLGLPMNTFIRLLVARDAYWKIAGDEMGLGKPWEPDWSDASYSKYIIDCFGGEICKGITAKQNTTFAFPTEEIRNAFKENFDKDLEICKEFL